ncbi:MAG: hypothetical protein HPM95_17185 [Alphaproteobacteria bacterium]|nr:hypothetical protein [Alphaproteobacteria bacterium]
MKTWTNPFGQGLDTCAQVERVRTPSRGSPGLLTTDTLLKFARSSASSIP